MSIFRYASCVILIVAMAACSSGESPQAAVFVPPAESSTDFGDLRVHYNALPSLSLNDAMAKEYGVRKDAGTGMMVIALRKLSGETELGAEGEISAVAIDLQGKRQQVDFSTIKTGEYTDHLGLFTINARDTYRFEVTAKSNGRTEIVKFQRNF